MSGSATYRSCRTGSNRKTSISWQCTSLQRHSQLKLWINIIMLWELTPKEHSIPAARSSTTDSHSQETTDNEAEAINPRDSSLDILALHFTSQTLAAAMMWWASRPKEHSSPLATSSTTNSRSPCWLVPLARQSSRPAQVTDLGQLRRATKSVECEL